MIQRVADLFLASYRTKTSTHHLLQVRPYIVFGSPINLRRFSLSCPTSYYRLWSSSCVNLQAWFKHFVCFCRDGVSEGQFYQVLLYELDAIRKACASLEPDYQPPVTFVVVQKRHHTRLFASNHNDNRTTDRSGNILPGTVFTSQQDFYFESIMSVKYHVLIKEETQELSLIMCGLVNMLCLCDLLTWVFLLCL